MRFPSGQPLWQNGHAALHAARALVGQLRVAAADQELLEGPVADALDRIGVGDAVPGELQEAAELPHYSPSPTRSGGAPTTSTASPANSSAPGAAWASSWAASSARTRL